MKIIHLSDFHLNKGVLESNHKRILDALIKDMEQFEIGDDSILIFSGDFLNCGGKNMNSLEENNFNVFKRLVFDPIYEKFPNLKNRTFFCAGNHDIDRSAVKTTHKVIKESLIRDEKNRQQIYKELRKDNIVGFEKYNEFVSEFYINFKENKDISNLESNFSFDLNENKVGVSSLNSSFLCYDDNDHGNILIFEEQIKESIGLIDGCDVKIAILHHPISFLHKSESEKVEELLQKKYDLVFLGHTHKQKEFYYKTLIGSCFFSIGKSLNGEEDEKIDYTNGYSILEYTPNQKIRAILRKYNHLGEKFIPNSDYGDENGIFEIDINKNINNKNINNQNINELKISASFRKYLNDVGANLTHKDKQIINLDDIFIYPYLEQYNISDSSDEEKVFINSEKLLNEIKEEEIKIVLLGEDSSGKTSLCKKAFEVFFNKGTFFPILINGDDIKKIETKSLEKLKNILLSEQYESEKIPASRKPLLIIDNFNESKLDTKNKRLFIKNLIKENFPFILVWDEFLTLNEVCGTAISEVDIYEILPLGIEYRYKLIQKWIELSDFTNEEEKTRLKYELRKLVDLIIGKNLVPSYPLYILTILQTTELLPNQNLEQSTFGHYYDVLIRLALGKNIDNKEIEKYYSYLSELSFYLFKQNIKSLNEDEFIAFNKYFKDNYKINTSFVDTREKLVSSDIINMTSNTYKFRYDYIYYYFLGKYLADNLDEENIKSTIISIADTLYNTHSANTYLFLSHHTKSMFVIETIVKTAKKLFEDEKVATFSDDINQVNELINQTSQNLVLDISKSYIENKEEELKEQDKNTINSEEYNSIDYISKINKVFKTIEILGLILKNRYASLKEDKKYNIAEEVYLLGLRTTSTIFKTLIEGEEFLKNDLIKIIGTERTFSKMEQEQLAKRIIFNIYYMTAYAIIKRISNSIATKDLELTFSDIENKYQGNNAIGLIDIANKFEYSPQFPFKNVEKLISQFKNNKFPFFLLRRLSYNYLRIFPMNISEKQRICEKLDISIDSQRRIQKSSKIKKRK